MNHKSTETTLALAVDAGMWPPGTYIEIWSDGGSGGKAHRIYRERRSDMRTYEYELWQKVEYGPEDEHGAVETIRSAKDSLRTTTSQQDRSVATYCLSSYRITLRKSQKQGSSSQT
jgi:hypothetical protein